MSLWKHKKWIRWLNQGYQHMDMNIVFYHWPTQTGVCRNVSSLTWKEKVRINHYLLMFIPLVSTMEFSWKPVTDCFKLKNLFVGLRSKIRWNIFLKYFLESQYNCVIWWSLSLVLLVRNFLRLRQNKKNVKLLSFSSASNFFCQLITKTF